jgi:hypothetical protein
MVRIVLRVSATLLAVLCFAPWLSAREQPEVVPVTLSGDDPWLRFEVYSYAPEADPKVPIFVCRNPCRMRLPLDQYRVRVTGTAEQVGGDRTIAVTRPSRFRFSLPERSAKNAGLAIGIAAPAVAITGLYVAIAAYYSEYSCSDCRPAEERRREIPAGVYVGLGVAAVGAVLTPVGWILFAANGKPRFREHPRVAARRPARAPRFGIGAAPIAGGAATGVWGSF